MLGSVRRVTQSATEGAIVLNTLYRTIGGAVLLALIVILVGPLFVDWTSYRAAFEREASLALGQPVRVLGSADMQILPLPHLQFQTVHVGEDQKSPLLVVDEFDVRIELFPLLKGKIDVVDMTLKSPRLRVSLDEQGQFAWRQKTSPMRDLDLEKIRLNDVRIEQGTLLFDDASSGRKARFDNITGNLSARSLIGPYKLEATLSSGNEPFSLILSSGRATTESVRIKSLLTPFNRPVSWSMDGKLGRGEDGRYHYLGNSVINNNVEGANGVTAPWELIATTDLSVGGVSLPKFELQYGQSDQAYRLNGAGQIDFGAEPKFDIQLTSRQLDLDRNLGQGPDAPLDLRAGMGTLTGAIARLPIPPIRGKVSFDAPGVILGGGILRNLEIKAELVDNGWQFETLEADLPGYSFLSMRGLFSRRSIGDMPAHAFEGSVRLRSDQPEAFAKWWLKDAPASGRLEPFDLSAQLVTRADRLSLDRIELDMDGDRSTGRLDWFRGTKDTGDKASSLALQLKADRLDLDVLQGVGSLLMRDLAPVNAGEQGRPAGLSEVVFDIEARNLVSNDLTGEGLAAKLRMDASGISIEDLRLEDFAGARFSVQGGLRDLLTNPRGQISGRIKADDLQGLSRIASLFATDHPVSKWFAARHDALAPIDLSFEADGQGTDQALALVLTGEMGGGQVQGDASLDGPLQQWAAQRLAMSLVIDNSDGTNLLRLAGADPFVSGLPPMRATLAINGILAEKAEASMSVVSGQSQFSFDGDLGYEIANGFSGSGILELKVDDLEPYLLASGVPLSNPGLALPVSLKSDFSFEGKQGRWSNLSGSWDSQPVSGALAYEETVARRKLSGKLALGDLDGIWLAETIAGPGRLTVTGNNWPDLAFLAQNPDPNALPFTLDLKISGRSLELASPYIFQQPSFTMLWQANKLILGDFKALLAGGNVTGGLTLNNVEGELALNGLVNSKDTALAPFIWQRDGRSVANGQLDLRVSLESQGRSMAGLMSGLSGNGSFEIRDGVIHYLNPQAFELVVRAVDAGLELKEEEIARSFTAHLDAGSTDVSRVSGAFRIAGGALRANNIVTEAEILKSRGNAVLDISSQTVQGDWAIKVEPNEEDAVTGAVPEVGLVFAGDLASPTRRVDVAPFTGYLSIRAFEKEVERVENLQADILEKERMRRLLKLYREKEKRREAEKLAEEQRQREEAARLESEKKAAEEKARREALEAEQERRQAEEERKLREEAERQRKAREEAQRLQAERERLADEEARRARQEAERKRQAEEEAARQRLLLEQQEQSRPFQNGNDASSDDSSEIQVRPLPDLIADEGAGSPEADVDPSGNGPILLEEPQSSIVLPDLMQKLPRRPASPSEPDLVVPSEGNSPSYNQLIERLRQSPDRIIQLE